MESPRTCFLQDERVEGVLEAWAASRPCAGSQGWTAAGSKQEEEEKGGEGDTAVRESYLCHLHRGQKQPAPKVLLPTISCEHPTARCAPLTYSLTQIDWQPHTVQCLFL